jgi:hypothetical protein
MKLQQKIFGIGLLTAVIVPHLYEKGYKPHARINAIAPLRSKFSTTIACLESAEVSTHISQIFKQI